MTVQDFMRQCLRQKHKAKFVLSVLQIIVFAVAQEAIDSGLYDTIQFPFCYLATDKDIAIVENCKKIISVL